jgi:hypothetical protein
MVARGEAVTGHEGLRDRESVGLCPAHVFGVFLILAGCLVVFLFGRTDHLICRRASSSRVTCELRETFVGAPLEVRRVEHVQGVRLEACNRSEGREPVYRVVVNSPGSEVALGFPGSAAEDKERIADEVAQFLDNPTQPDLALQRVEVEGWFFGGMSILSGLVVLLYVSEFLLCLPMPTALAARDR